MLVGKGTKTNEVTIPGALYNEVIDYLAEELYITWHPEKSDGCQLALNPNYEHEKSLEHYGKYSGGVDVLNIMTGVTIPEIEADARSLAKRCEKEREIGRCNGRAAVRRQYTSLHAVVSKRSTRILQSLGATSATPIGTAPCLRWSRR